MNRSESKFSFVIVPCLLLLIILLGIGMFPLPAGAEGACNDIRGHWAEEAICRMFQASVVEGYEDGSFRPDMSVSRAEFVTMVNKAMGFNNVTSIDFADVNRDDWYHDEIARAVKAGYIKGDTDGSMNPDRHISRQEAAVIFFRLLEMEEEKAKRPVDSFKDSKMIASWSNEAVNRIVLHGYMRGYPDQIFDPLGETSRAETVVMLNRVLGVLYDEPGSYGPSENVETIDDNVTITVSGVTLQNMIIKGDLFLTAGIGDGEVFIKNVTVEGRTLVTGGGPDSVFFEDSTLGMTIIRQDDGTVRVVFAGSTSVSSLVIKSGGIIEITTQDGEVISVEVGSSDDIELNGNYGTVTVEAEGANISIMSGNIGRLVVAEGAAGSNIHISGGASVNTLECNASVSVSGMGRIRTLTVHAGGVSTQQRPANLLLDDGLEVEIAGEIVDESYEEQPFWQPRLPSGPSLPAVSLTVPQADYYYTEAEINLTDLLELTTDATVITASSANKDVVEVTADGTRIEVTPKGAGTAVITVTGSRSGYRDCTVTFSVTVYIPEVTMIDISGPQAVSVPHAGQPDNSVQYTALVYDQYGVEMEGVALDWGIGGSPEGVNIDAGTLMVTEDAPKGVITITAAPTDGVVSGEFEVTLFKEFAGGAGTETDPWQIETPQQLDNVRSYLGGENDDKHFILVDHIDLAGYGAGYDGGKGWEPLGSGFNPFAGHFNGGRFTVSSLYINRPEEDSVGLFGTAKSAVIENLGLVDVNITGASHVGGLVGYSSGGTIESCYAAGDVTGYQSVGGLAGAGEGSILCSYAAGAVSGSVYVGGLAGSWGNGPDDIIENSYAKGTVFGIANVAGLVAVNHGSVNKCYSVGPVTGSGPGGLISITYGEVTNSYWDKETSGISFSAGGEIGKPTSEMIQESTFTDAGWDFDVPGVWKIEEGESYPYLKWQGEENIPYPPEAEPAALREIAVLEPATAGNGIHILGDYAYTTGIMNGLGVIDISNPEAPEQVGPFNHGPSHFCGLYVQGNRAYVAADTRGIDVFDISDPENPILSHTIDLGGWNARDIDVSSDFAYVANTRGGLEVINIDSQARVAKVLSSDYYVNAVSVFDAAYACVATWEWEPDLEQLWTIDISNPSEPIPLAAVELPGRSFKLAAAGDYVYAGTNGNGLLVIDASNPQEPEIVAELLSHDVRGIYVCGSYAYVTAVIDSVSPAGALYQLDISDPGNPVEICSVEIEGVPRRVWVDDNFVYIVDNGKLRVVEISANP